MRIQRERIFKTARHPGEVYFTARGRGRFNGVWWRTVGWGSTPTKARLNLLYQMGRRRTSAE